MNLWFRLFHLLLATPFRARLSVPAGVSRLTFRCWFNDLDLNGHMTNSRYLTIFDLGRTDLMIRMGLLGQVMKHKWAPIVGAGGIRFRRELKLFQPFVLETRLLAWTASHVIFEQRILIGPDETVAARGAILAGLYDRKARAFVPPAALFEQLGAIASVSPPLDGVAQALLDLDASLKTGAGK